MQLIQHARHLILVVVVLIATLVVGVGEAFAANLSLVLGNSASTTISIPAGASVTVPNAPAWLTTVVESSTATFTATPPTLGHGRWDVFVNGVPTDILTVNVYPAPEDVEAVANALPVEDIEKVISTGGSITHTNPQFFQNPDGETWTAVFAYYPGYNNNQQIITVDLATGEVGVNDTTTFTNESWHQFVAVPGPGNKSYINPKGGSPLYIRIHSYDTETHTWDYDIAGTHDDHRGTSQASKIAVGTNGRIYSLGMTADGNHSVLEVDPNDSNSTRFYNNIPAAGDPVAVAADDEYVYVLSDPYAVRHLTAINLETDERSLVATGTSLMLYQRKYGVVTSGHWGWLYHGELSHPSYPDDLNDNPPWGVDDTDLYAYSSVYATAEPPSEDDYDKTAMIPAEGSTGRFWFRDPANPSGDMLSVTIPGILKYPPRANRVRVLSNGNVMYATGGYNGYGLYDPMTDTMEVYRPAEGTNISNYTITDEGNIAYISGYFGAPVLQYDITQPWDNAISDAYDPNRVQVFANPRYLGPLGNEESWVGKAYSSTVGADGKAYFAGEKVRSGSGGGIFSYNPNTDEVIPYKDENENYRNVVRAGKYVIGSSFADVTTHPIQLTVLDTDLGEIVRTIHPTADIFNNAGRLVGSHDGTPYVYVFTESDDETITRFIKVNVETGDVVYDRAYPLPSNPGGYNDGGRSDMLFAADGFLYAMINETKWLIRLDPETGDMVPIRVFTHDNSAGRFDALGDDLYLAGDTRIRRISNFTVTYNLGDHVGATPTPACADTLDNDADGLIDYPDDPGCESADDTDEYNAPTPTLAADFNADNTVDIFDYSLLVTNFGHTGECGTPGDADNDCAVNIFDYNVLLGEFGRSV